MGIQMKPTSIFLTLDKNHIVELAELTPESIKRAAKKATTDREKISHTTILNAVASKLGFKEGFSGFKKSYVTELTPFLEKHQLIKKSDLCTFRNVKHSMMFQKLKPQDISERLFYSGKQISQKIFTGYDFDFEHTIEDGYWYLNSFYGDKFTNAQGGEEHFEFTGSASCTSSIEHNIKLAKKYKNLIVPELYNGYHDRTVLDIVLGGMLYHLATAYNLLGDMLVFPSLGKSITKIYYPLDSGLSLAEEREEQRNYLKMTELFRSRITKAEAGWVEIIPFNDKLIFLKGSHGEYDFVVKNQRASIFEHQIYGGALKRDKIPKFIDDYSFFRWHFFEYEGWREMDAHEAEKAFYKANSIKDYPSSNVLLKDYYKKKNVFCNDNMFNARSRELPGFYNVKCKQAVLMVSNLISIEQFELFIKGNTDYMQTRIGCSLDSVNDEINKALPVTLTWFDCLAFIDWRQKQLPAASGIIIRLLKEKEYKDIRGGMALPLCPNAGVEYIKVDGSTYINHPPYMSDCDFEQLVFRFKTPLDFSEHKSGLRFIDSANCAEWLMEKTCIRSNNLKSFGNNELIVRDSPPLTSTGKYKRLKTGFRLCYELAL